MRRSPTRRQIARWHLSVPVPTTISTTMLSRSWSSDPQASSQLANAHETPMSAPAGMVVTEMKTPRRALVRASASETMPTTPASTATTAEKKLGC